MAQSALEAVFGSTPRILAASFTAYVAGSLSNAKIMELMHMHDGEKRLAWRCIASTIGGETLDMTVFTLLAFTGVLPWPVIGQMIVVASAIKVAVECICYPLVTSHVIAWARRWSRCPPDIRQPLQRLPPSSLGKAFSLHAWRNVPPRQIEPAKIDGIQKDEGECIPICLCQLEAFSRHKRTYSASIRYGF